MQLAALKFMRQVLADKLAELDEIKPRCMNCIHFSKGRTCDQFNAAPPTEWRDGTQECAQWEHDGIPF